MSFFTSLYNSLYNFKWLSSQKSNTSSAWSYFFLLIVLMTGLTTISMGYKLADAVPKIKQALYNELPEFQAEVKNGQLQVNNLVQPYVKSYSRLAIVVDTVSTSTIDINSYVKQGDRSVLLITKDAFTAYDAQDKSVKTQVLKEYSDFKTDRNGVLKIADGMFSKKIFAIVMAVLFILMLVFLFSAYLLSVLVFGFLFYSIAKQQKMNWKFKEVFNVGLFTITLPLILVQSTSIIYLNWIFVLVYTGWMYMVILKRDKIV